MDLNVVVVTGAAAGSKLIVGAEPKCIGRAATCDLVLPDPYVSRRHVEARAVDGAVEVRALEGARDVLVNDLVVSRATLQPSGRFLLGETVLEVRRAGEPERPTTEREVHETGARPTGDDIRTLLSSPGEEAQGLASVFRLAESLDGAATREEVVQQFAAWAARDVGAGETILDALPPVSGEGTQRAWSLHTVAEHVCCAIYVPAHGADPCWARLSLPVPAAEVSTGKRRLLAVAGRVVASRLAQVREVRAARAEKEELRRVAVGSASVFLGQSGPAVEVERTLQRLAPMATTVLLLGESGTGKTFAARLIHEGGPRASEPLRVVNCAAIPEALVEGELFGHERGAFSGAVAARIGVLEAVGGGTLVLDEIAELPLTSQAKLLRVLEERSFERLGSNQTRKLRARIIAATNRDPEAMVREGKLRADLLFRLAVVRVSLPSLRDRPSDIRGLAAAILLDVAAEMGRRVGGFSEAALVALERYTWPGNVRELKNAIEHALTLGEGSGVEISSLPRAVQLAGATSATAGPARTVTLPMPLDRLERLAIQAALEETGGNRTHAAALLGIHRHTLAARVGST